MIESSLVDFAVTSEALSAGKHKVEVRAFDAAGNTASDQTEVKVEAGGEAKGGAAGAEKTGEEKPAADAGQKPSGGS